MKQKRTLVTLVLIIALLCLGIAYAAISNVGLTIEGSATATASSENFSVIFVEEGMSTTKNPTSITILGDVDDNDATIANITCSGMSAKGDEGSVTYVVKNTSADLAAEVTASLETTHTKFDVSQSWGTTKKVIPAGQTDTITVNVELLETIIGEPVTEDITVQLTAVAVAPVVE